MEWYEREVPPTSAGGGDASSRMRSRVVAGGLATIDVLTAGEGQVATGCVFVEPQLPMTHLQAIQSSGLYGSGRSVGGGRRLAK